MTSSSNTVPVWFSTLIGDGLASLYLLNLDGCPAADSTAAMSGIWAHDMWNSRKRFWHQDADTGCIREAFATLRQNCQRWPTPAKFWEVLPSRPPPTGRLLGPSFGRDRQAEALQCQKRQFADMGYDQFGKPLQ